MSDVSTRGFTGHEHLDDVELIHMNGRAFDYNLGRFLSVDPFIVFPKNSQSINAYSYLMNNPLSGTDPSGYTGVQDQLSSFEDFDQLASLEEKRVKRKQKAKKKKKQSVGDNFSSKGTDVVKSLPGESKKEFLERIAPRWTKLTNDEKAEVSSKIFHNKETDQYAVVPYSTGLPHLSVALPKSKQPKDVQKQLKGFATTKETVHSHGPKVSWGTKLKKKTRAFIRNYSSDKEQIKRLTATYITPFSGKKGIVKLGGNRRKPSDEDKINGSGFLITDRNRVVPFEQNTKNKE